jgi:hypothetical protein
MPVRIVLVGPLSHFLVPPKFTPFEWVCPNKNWFRPDVFSPETLEARTYLDINTTLRGEIQTFIPGMLSQHRFQGLVGCPSLLVAYPFRSSPDEV